MTDIIFHIGFPKCASSTFQNIVFPQTKGYLGGGKETPEKFKYAKKFQDISPAGPSITSSLSEAKKWAKQLLKLKEEEYPNINRLILSSEFYTMHNILSHKPIIPFLKKFKETIWKENGAVKIIVVLRNQAELLASGYAQNSITNPNASLEDFKNHSDYLLNKYYHKLDYSSWVQSLFENFGRENVCVLLMEDIKKLEFWSELKNFAELTEFDPNSMINGENVANKKGINKDTWKLFDYSARQHAKNKVNNYLKVFWPGYISPKYRLKAKKTAINLLEKRYVKKFTKDVSNRERSFQLTDEIRFNILEAYKDSNVQLNNLIDRDLSTIGYI